LGRTTLELEILGSVQAVGLRERARIGRILTAEDPNSDPKVTAARLLGVSHQALYPRRPSRPPRCVGRGRIAARR
jgi:hypothetical protein